jgi:RNA polymerase sigma-70 factor (ECF subfamily)
MTDNESESSELVNRVLEGDEQALAELFSECRDRLWRMVNFRMDPRLRKRVDPDDVLQEAYMNAVQRIDKFRAEASRSILIWFRMIVTQTMVDIYRRHLGAQKRSAGRDVSMHGGWKSDSTSMSLSFHLLGHLTSPSHAALRAEISQQIDTALSTMNDIDREVLALRHFEELSNNEAAQVLNITEQAASLRYVRALSRLKDVMEAIPGFLDEWQTDEPAS